MIEKLERLSGLRPLHLPEEPSFWPLALGWWLLLALILIGSALGLGYLKNRPSLHREALTQLKQLQADYQRNKLPLQALRQISQLLKRLAMTLDRRAEVASLSGAAWLAYLNKRQEEPFLLGGDANLFVEAQYKEISLPASYMDKLFERAETWIRGSQK